MGLFCLLICFVLGVGAWILFGFIRICNLCDDGYVLPCRDGLLLGFS